MKNLPNSGFTIVETLVVLAVSGVIFISAVLMVGGQQSKVQFRNAMTDITSDIQKTTNEAASGFYPNTGATPFWCHLQGARIRIQDAPGNNRRRVLMRAVFYLGRAIMFDIPGADTQSYFVHTVVGLKKDPASAGKKEVTSFAEAQAIPIARDPPEGVLADITETRTLQYGTRVAWMRGPAGQPLAGLAFVINPDQTGYTSGGATEQLKSGVPTVAVLAIPAAPSGSETGLNMATGVDRLRDSLRNATYLTSASICFSSGATDQSALVNIGSTGGTSSVEYNIFNNTTCTP